MEDGDLKGQNHHRRPGKVEVSDCVYFHFSNTISRGDCPKFGAIAYFQLGLMLSHCLGLADGALCLAWVPGKLQGTPCYIYFSKVLVDIN